MLGEGIDATEILSEEDIVIHRDQSAKNKFEFDRILSPGTPQETVFEAVQPLIVSVLDGYNVCIFACESSPLFSPSLTRLFFGLSLDGQTGSGKVPPSSIQLSPYFSQTFTMEGYGTDIGVSPRAIDEVFRVVNNSVEDWTYTVRLLLPTPILS
jgi:hypothetical protein